jgi:hypothetical protein
MLGSPSSTCFFRNGVLIPDSLRFESTIVLFPDGQSNGAKRKMPFFLTAGSGTKNCLVFSLDTIL